METGKYENTLPVVLANNTQDAVADVHLSGTAYGPDGKLLVTGEDQGVNPEVIPAGGLAIAYVYLQDKKLPAGSRVDIDVSSTPASKVEFQSNVDLPIKKVRYVAGRVVGIASNPLKTRVNGPFSVYAACIDAKKQLVKFGSAYADKDAAEAQEDVPFTVDLTAYDTTKPPSCKHILVSVRGYSF